MHHAAQKSSSDSIAAKYTINPSNRAQANTPSLTVTWAQRSSSSEAEKNHVFLAIMVPDVSPQNIKLDVQPGSLDFTGYSESKKANYHVHLDFYKEIDPSASKTNHTSRAVEFVLQKKDLEVEYWPRLLKDAKKVHFLKTDFDKVRYIFSTPNFQTKSMY